MADNSLNLTLGKGKLYFGEFASGTQTPKGERFIGNCLTIAINAEVEELDHISSTDGRKKKDFSAVTGVDRKGNIVTDNMGLDNVGVYALGLVETVTVTSATGSTSVFTGVSPGLGYQLGVTTAKPEGVRKVASVVVTNGLAGLSAVTYAVNTDYTVDADRGRITVVAGGAIAEASNLSVTYNVTAHTVRRVVAGGTQKEGSLRFISANPDGPVTDYFFPWVKLGPNGDLNLISESEWATIPLSIEVFEKDGIAPWVATGQPVTS